MRLRPCIERVMNLYWRLRSCIERIIIPNIRLRPCNRGSHLKMWDRDLYDVNNRVSLLEIKTLYREGLLKILDWDLDPVNNRVSSVEVESLILLKRLYNRIGEVICKRTPCDHLNESFGEIKFHVFWLKFFVFCFDIHEHMHEIWSLFEWKCTYECMMFDFFVHLNMHVWTHVW